MLSLSEVVIFALLTPLLIRLARFAVDEGDNTGRIASHRLINVYARIPRQQ